MSEDFSEDMEGFDDFDFGDLDDDLYGDSDFSDLDPSGGDEPKGRSPVEDVGTGIADAVKDIKLTKPPFGTTLTDAFPKTSSLFETAAGVVSVKDQIQREATKELAPAINQMKLAGRRVLPKVKGILPENIYNKVYDKLQPKEEANKGPSLEDQRESIIAQQLDAMAQAEQAQEAENQLKERTDKYIQEAISRGEHKDQMSILAGIKAYEHAQTKFSVTTFKNYLAKSLELKYRHMFIAKDTHELMKGFVKSAEKRLEAIAHNTALPDIQKKKKMESVKEMSREALIGKGMKTVGDWSQDFRKELMDNVKKKASEYIQTARSGMEDVGGMANQYLDLEEMEAEFAEPGDERSALASGTKMAAGTGIGFASRKLAGNAIKLAGRHGIDLENFSESIQERMKYAINNELQDKEGGIWDFLKTIVPNIDKERGGRNKNLLDNAFEEVAWNVMDHRALVDIIPGYLSKQTKFLEDISKGTQDSEELVFDPKKEDFVRADEFREGLEKKYFGTQESRTSDITEGVGKLLGAYTIHGGDEAEFYESMQDVVKFLNNSAKHMRNIEPKKIAKLAKGEDLKEGDTYERDVFLGIENKENLIQLLNKALTLDGEKVDTEVSIDIDNFAKKLAKQRDDVLKDINVSAGVGTSRYYDDILTDTGRLDHRKANEKYADVDYDKLRKEAFGVGQNYAMNLAEHDKDRLFTSEKYEEAFIPESTDSDKAVEQKVKNIESRMDKAVQRMENLAKAIEDEGLSALKRKPEKDDIKNDIAEAVQDIKEEQKSKGKADNTSDPIVKDTPHVSGPGVYVQGSEQELHAPLDKLDKLWDSLIPKLKSSGVYRPMVDSLEKFKDELFPIINDNSDITHEYLDMIYEATVDLKTAVVSIPKLSFPDFDIKELFNVKDVEKPGAFKKILGVGKAGLNLGWQATKGVTKRVAPLALDGVVGGTRMAGSTIKGLHTTGMKTLGAGRDMALGFVSKIGGPKDNTPKLLLDLYRQGEDEPLVTKKQLKNAVYQDGMPVRNVNYIDQPVMDKKTGVLLITEEDIEHGLVTANKKPLLKLNKPQLPTITEEQKEKGKSLISKAGGLLGSTAKATWNLGKAGINASKTPIGGMTRMGFAAAGNLGNLSLDLTRKVLGLDKSGTTDTVDMQKSLKDEIGLRLDKIYDLLVMRLPGEGTPDEEKYKPSVDIDRVIEEVQVKKKEKTKLSKLTDWVRSKKNKFSRKAQETDLEGIDLDEENKPEVKTGTSRFTKPDIKERKDNIIRLMREKKHRLNELTQEQREKVSSRLSTTIPNFKETTIYKSLQELLPNKEEAITSQDIQSMLDKEDIEDDRQLEETLGTRLDKLYELQNERLDKPTTVKDPDGDGFRTGSYEEYMQAKKEKEQNKLLAKLSGGKLGKLKGRMGRTAGGLGLFGLAGRKRGGPVDQDDEDGGIMETIIGMTVAPIITRYLGKFKGAGKKLLTKIPGKALLGGLVKKIPGGKTLGKGLAATAGMLGLSKLFGGGEKEVTEQVGKKVASEAGEEVVETTAKKVTQEAVGKATEKGIAKTIGKEAVKEGAEKTSKSIFKKLGGKAAAKMGLKKIPGIGLLVGAGLAIGRMAHGDFKGAAMELASGAVSTVPGYGTAASIAIDAALIGRDVKKIADKSKKKASKVFETRMNMYGLKGHADLADIILKLEKYTADLIIENKKVHFRRIKRFANEMGFNHRDDEQMGFFYTWYKERFVVVLMNYIGILKKNFDKDLEDEMDLGEKDQEKAINALRKTSSEITISSQIIPTLKAYQTYMKDNKDEDLTGSLKDDDTTDISKKKPDVVKENYEENVKNHIGKVIPFDPSAKKQLGSVSAKWESRSDSSAVGYDRVGGTSYGKYQLSSATGTFDDFISWVEQQPGGEEVAERLRAAGEANTGNKKGKVPEEWKKLVKEGKMGELEHKFIKETHYDPVFEQLSPDLQARINKSRSLQDALWSTAVQHGVNNTPGIFKKIYKKDMSDTELIQALYDERSTRFPSSNKAVQNSIVRRYNSEQQQLLAMLEREDRIRTSIADRHGTPQQVTPIAGTDSIEKDISDRINQVDHTGLLKGVNAAISDNKNIKSIQDTTSAISKTIADTNNSDIRKNIVEDIQKGIPQTLVAEDKKSHELSSQQIAELRNINKNISNLNNVLSQSLGKGDIFAEMNNNIKKFSDKELNVNVDASQVNVAQTTQTQTQTRSRNGLNLEKKRSA